MLKPTYLQDIKRWVYNSLNNKLAPNETAIPIFDERMIVKLNSVLSSYRLVDQEEFYFSAGRLVKPFLTTTERAMYPGETQHMTVENDPVNSIDGTMDTSTKVNQMIEAERLIGNHRSGFKRQNIVIGDSPTIEELSDISTNLSTVPFFAPQPSNFDTPERTRLITSDNGYKEYMKSSNPTDIPSALHAMELTGKKVIIYDGADVNLKTETDVSGISAADSKNMKVDDIETILNSALSGVHANLGTFLPDEKSWAVVNIPGQCIIEASDTKYRVSMYNSAFSTLISEFSIDKATGTIALAAGTTTVNITKDGAVGIDAGTNDVTIDGANVDVTVTGTMDVN